MLYCHEPVYQPNHKLLQVKCRFIFNNFFLHVGISKWIDVLINRTIIKQYIDVIHWNLKNTMHTKNINPNYVSYEIWLFFMIVKIQMVFWVMVSGSLTSGYQRFRVTHCLRLQRKYWRYVTEKCRYRLPGHTLTSKKDHSIWFRLCYNAIHIAVYVLQLRHRPTYSVSVFSIYTKLKTNQLIHSTITHNIFTETNIFRFHTSR